MSPISTNIWMLIVRVPIYFMVSVDPMYYCHELKLIKLMFLTHLTSGHLAQGSLKPGVQSIKERTRSIHNVM